MNIASHTIDDKFRSYTFALDSGELSTWLWQTHRILVTSIKHPQFEGIRVSPSVYSTMEEIDRFCLAIEDAMANGIV